MYAFVGHKTALSCTALACLRQPHQAGLLVPYRPLAERARRRPTRLSNVTESTLIFSRAIARWGYFFNSSTARQLTYPADVKAMSTSVVLKKGFLFSSLIFIRISRLFFNSAISISLSLSVNTVPIQ